MSTPTGSGFSGDGNVGGGGDDAVASGAGAGGAPTGRGWRGEGRLASHESVSMASRSTLTLRGRMVRGVRCRTLAISVLKL